MKREKFDPSSWDYSTILDKIEESLNLHPLLSAYNQYELSFPVPKGIFNELRMRFSRQKLGRVYLKYNFFHLFSSVVVFPMSKSNGNLLVFKNSGRVPGELRLVATYGVLKPFVYPCLIYWKGTLWNSFPPQVIKKYPRINTAYFWLNLNDYSEVEEISLGRVKTQASGKYGVLIKEVLIALRIIPQLRGKNKSIKKCREESRKIIISKYNELCRKEPSYCKRYPVVELQAYWTYVASKGEGFSEMGTPDFQTIRRWLNAYKRDLKQQEMAKDFLQELPFFAKEFKRALKKIETDQDNISKPNNACFKEDSVIIHENHSKRSANYPKIGKQIRKTSALQKTVPIVVNVLTS